MTALSEDLEFRGIVVQMTDDDLAARLDQDQLTFYIGFDPSSSSLHVGSLLQIATLRRFQLAGHRPIALVGGGTGMIGDPGGKVGERALLSSDEVEANVEGITAQLGQFVDLGTGLVVDNGSWLRTLEVIDFLRNVGKHFTVNQMVAKESVRARLERPDQGISYTEFSYMLLQAYDFLRLREDHGCELQVGGSDQWGNITMGVELIRRLSGKQAYGLTTPLVTKPDGTKFGKTEEGTIWLDPSRTRPFRFYQFLLQTEDAVVGAYLRFFTDLSHEEILSLDVETAERPQRRAAQRALAHEVSVLVHGEEETERAERASTALFGEQIATLPESLLLDVVGEAPSTTVPRERVTSGAMTVLDAMVASGLDGSRAAARRTITQGGAYLNNRRIDDPDQVIRHEDLLHDRYVVLRKGRRDYHLVVAG